MTECAEAEVADTPLVSILTPSFNQGRFIRDALDSVACQTYSRVEHIVMDGCSTDDTVSILQSYGSSLTWKSERDRGQCDALNKAFRLATGEIIGWLNSDDAYFDCGVIERVVKAFRQNPTADIVYGHAVRIDSSGRIVWILWTPRFSYRLMRRMNFLVQPSVFLRRSALPGNLVDEDFDFTMDWELWLRLGRDHRFHRLDSVLAADRHHDARKNQTAIDVFRENEARMTPLYGLGRGPSWRWNLYHRFYGIRQRLMGGLYVDAVANASLAFSGYVESARALRSRQVLRRRTRWSEADRAVG